MRTVSVLSILLLGALSLVTAGERPADDGIRVYLDQRNASLVAGQSGFVAVKVAGVPPEGLTAFQVTLAYDPRRIQVRNPNAGFGVPEFAPLGGSPLCAVVRQQPSCPDPEWMLSTTGRSPLGTNSIDAQQGRLTIAYGTSGLAAPAAGNGTLALIEVVGQGRGRGALRIVDVILVDPSEPPRSYPVVLQDEDARRVRGRWHERRD